MPSDRRTKCPLWDVGDGVLPIKPYRGVLVLRLEAAATVSRAAVRRGQDRRGGRRSRVGPTTLLGGIEVVLHVGRSIRVRSGFNRALLSEIVAALESLPGSAS